MVGAGVHVHARQGVHDSRHRRLPGARLRPHRLLRGGYHRAAVVDGAAHRDERADAEGPAHAGRAAVRARPEPGPGPGRAVRTRLPGESVEMRRLRRTKILATLGPASSDAAAITRLFQAGADVFRINMSHTAPDRMRAIVAMIRDVEKEFGRPIGVLVDLQGPKLRVGAFAGDGAVLKKGATFTLDSDPAPGNDARVHLPHPEILAAAEPGHRLLLDDGKIRLVVTEASPKRAVTRVEVGGKLTARKGVSLPDTIVPFSALTPKDRTDLEAAVDAGTDWLALSFIQRAEDIAEARKLVRGRCAIMSKIEKPQAVTRLADIMDASDAIMVARGDLGVEMPLEKVPAVQKQITRMARRTGKPVVVATQMLESMIAAPVPTRAEVSDVATAIYEGADAVMLS